jgi:hypothetical protein
VQRKRALPEQRPFKTIRSEAALQRPAELFEPVETLFDDIEAGRVAKSHGAIVPEGDAGNHGDVVLAKEDGRQSSAN